MKGDKIEFEVRDHMPSYSLDREIWNRVVAFFIVGPTWQFRNWPYYPDVSKITQKYKA